MTDTAPTNRLPVLTRGRLADLIECQRRFWLRNVGRVPWPADPLSPALELSLERGRLFHQLMERHFLGLETGPVPAELEPWWTAWQTDPVPLPTGRYLPELTLSVPLSGARLLVRYDLLVLAADNRALILDWKTTQRPRSREDLGQDLQTRLYPLVLVEGVVALTDCAGRRFTSISAERVELIYWQANGPTHPARFPYSADQHTRDLGFLAGLAAQARALQSTGPPPVLQDLAVCARCSYRTYCHSTPPPAAGKGTFDEPDDEVAGLSADLEPPG